MQTIMTKYMAPTNWRGAFIKAVQSGWSSDSIKQLEKVTMAYDYALTSDENHRRAAQLLALRLNWTGTYVSGSLGALGDYDKVFVRIPHDDYEFAVDPAAVMMLRDAETNQVAQVKVLPDGTLSV